MRRFLSGVPDSSATARQRVAGSKSLTHSATVQQASRTRPSCAGRSGDRDRTRLAFLGGRQGKHFPFFVNVVAFLVIVLYFTAFVWRFIITMTLTV